MKEAIRVFKRYEKKYLLTGKQYQSLRKKLAARMQVDQYGIHTICNVYFDTQDYYLIRTSLNKPVYKEKFRLRSYGIPKQDDMVYLEIKKKFDGVVYKRRIPLSLGEAEQYLYHKKKRQDSSQIAKEIDWMLQRYQLEPAVYIAYDRLALFSKEDPKLRITFDQNIRFREHQLLLDKGSYGNEIFRQGAADGAKIDEEGRILMEVKLAGSMPLWMSHCFGELGIYPGSFSKYGYCYKNYISQFKKEEGGISYAS